MERPEHGFERKYMGKQKQPGTGDSTELVQPEPDHRQLRWTNHQKQNVLFRALRYAAGQSQNIVIHSGVDRCGSSGHLAILGGMESGPALLADPTSFASAGATPTGTAASVNFDGSPLAPNYNPTGGSYTLGGLRCFSVFGNVKADGTPFGAPSDCPGGTPVVNATPWDTFRPGMDSTGFIQKVLSMMPHANFFAATGGATGTDGLNTATYRRVQGTHGPDGGSVGTIIGTVGNSNDYNGRKQINLKIDHNINSKHRLSANWTYERTGGPLSLSGWGTGLDGQTRRRPQFLTVNERRHCRRRWSMRLASG